MADSSISALILARDEARNLPGCVASLSWVDEVVIVVDPASRDDTLEVAARLTNAVVVRPFDTFAQQRNAALERATGRWVFAVDADERSSPEQAEEIRRAITVHAGGAAPAGFRVPIRSEILGRPFAYSGTQNDRPLRLFQRDLGRWTGDVHETVAIAGAIGRIRTPLSHRTLPDIQTFLSKLDRYTTLEAGAWFREGRRPAAADWTVRPLWTFARLYLGRQGFRDGMEGFVFCALSGLSVAVRGWKLRELARGQEPSRARFRACRSGEPESARPEACPTKSQGAR
jgi:glycosyltransferase involved in cell wall biosynthesis